MKLITSTTNSLHHTTNAISGSRMYVGQSSGNIYPRSFDTTQKPRAHQYSSTPLYATTANTSCQPPKTYHAISSNTKVGVSSHQPNQGFIPKVTPNPILKTPSKVPIEQSRFVKSETLSDTQPRTYTPTAMKIKR